MLIGTPTKSDPKLSESARHIVLPEDIVSTAWPSVRDKCRDLGIRFMRWQDGAGRAILSKREDGLYAAGIGGVFLSIPRQVGKTFLLGAITFALCLIHSNLTVLWTAHRTRTADETFRSMQAMAGRKLIKPYIAAIRRGSGDQAVVFENGSRILFGARETGFGRGFPNVGIVVFDEAQILTQAALDDMVPAANQAENPLILYCGTPPKPTDAGEVFTRSRERALSGESVNALYIEFSADPKTDPTKWPKRHVDWEQVAKANPSFPRWTPKSAILRMMEQLGPDSFMLEGLGIWPETIGPERTIPAALWESRRTLDPPTTGGRVAAGVKYSLDGRRVSVALARKTDATHVEVTGVYPATEGTTIITNWLSKNWRDLCAIVIDGRSGAGALRQALLDEKVADDAIILPNVPQVQTAHSLTLTAIEEGTITHSDQPGLNASVASSTQRPIGRSGGWGWEAIGDGDTLPLEAVTYALFGAVTASRDSYRTAPPRRLY